ncbi:MAG: carbohydrate kinase family protein [Candidatus Bipolaricaulaceae bacterium]
MARESVVAVLGDLNWDLLFFVPELPKRGGETLSAKSQLRLGGAATNTARWLARLGFEVRLLAAVGTDPLGDLAAQELEKNGISSRFLRRVPERTGICCAIVDERGERTLFTSRGANTLLSPPLPEGFLEGAEWLHISGYALLETGSRRAVEEALFRARSRGIPVSLDPGMVAVHGHGAHLDEISPVDVFLPNEEEARALFGGEVLPASAFARKKYGEQVFLKHGERGCFVWDGENLWHIPAISVEVRHSLGAGDAFNAGVIAAALWGGSSLAQGILGNALGALCVAGLPAEPATVLGLLGKIELPEAREVERLVRAHWRALG